MIDVCTRAMGKQLQPLLDGVDPLRGGRDECGDLR
jgi:hypothetical protein